MKLYVSALPQKCLGCIFLRSIEARNGGLATGCFLLNIKINLEIATTTKLSSCPLIALTEDIK